MKVFEEKPWTYQSCFPGYVVDRVDSPFSVGRKNKAVVLGCAIGVLISVLFESRHIRVTRDPEFFRTPQDYSYSPRRRISIACLYTVSTGRKLCVTFIVLVAQFQVDLSVLILRRSEWKRHFNFTKSVWNNNFWHVSNNTVLFGEFHQSNPRIEVMWRMCHQGMSIMTTPSCFF